MDGYRKAAVLAVDAVTSGQAEDPVKAWLQATKRVFPASDALQNKGCPKGAFLGLCNAGMVKGIPSNSNGKKTKNGEYAIAAVNFLQVNRFLVSQPEMLWKKVAGNTKSENSQMDVVIGLWESNYIST